MHFLVCLASPNALQFVHVPLMTNAQCQATNYDPSQILPSMICAGLPQGGKASCQGDSGGPLVVPDANRKAIVYGVVSWAFKCAVQAYPGVNARVSEFVAWINANSA